jgi:hypothetical protein
MIHGCSDSSFIEIVGDSSQIRLMSGWIVSDSLSFAESLSFGASDGSSSDRSVNTLETFSSSLNDHPDLIQGSSSEETPTIVLSSSSVPSAFSVNAATETSSNGRRVTIVTRVITVQSDPTLSATNRPRSPQLSPIPPRSASSIFTASASLNQDVEIAPDARGSGTGSTGTVGIVLGVVFGLFALIALGFIIWFLLARERTEEEEAEPEVEFETETDCDDTGFSTEVRDECASGYQSQDLDQMIADEFAFSDVFTAENEEAAFSI